MFDQLRQSPKKVALATGSLVLLGLLLAGLRAQLAPKPQASAPSPKAAALPESVSALGRLEPDGDIHKLAAPLGAMGGSPRIARLLVQEGDPVVRGQLLASFDSRPGLLADQSLLQTRILNTTQQLRLLERDTNRYRRLAQSGATPSGDLDNREVKLLELRGQLAQARDQLRKTQTELVQSELLSPIDGRVLRILARPGERPGSEGILELGATDQMQAVAEVYESDISRVRLGQPVKLISENGGFEGTIRGRVVRIAPQVRQRKMLSTDPTGDADARVVEVRISLDPVGAERVQRLTGLKVIVRFQP
ncbi:efflux RND transporter periplasmic adaptor subunit [Cyanobium sp. WAJ14-Wanaka]|uniref:efflux RND transporter periplasmic adaptor subunit n=1 Tax=Cyanobium sp. WAJ14-Wanaka TaxID=2823725 RepID=UPI0020CCF709|nr:efflux RND transporter periplasmic adaptor subunit [Cyanobium sp. WAJ14-Wanaka]MCP9774601.1 efflux RND transporter periplasmic adaptor subunit [Cyanobium sp. WAJ14-Wanaka]